MLLTIMREMPATIRTNQFVHRQPRYWYRKPPTRGPMTAPFIGPTAQMEKTKARYFSSVISEREPGAMAIMHDPRAALGYD